jgi:hypothetical protein
MLLRILKVIGVGDEILARLDQSVLAFQRPGLLWVGLVLLVPAGWFIVRRQRRNLSTASPALRASLSLTRVAVLSVLVVVLAGPYLRIDFAIEKRPVVALLFDRSASMQLPAGPFSTSDEAAALVRAASAQPSAGALPPASTEAKADERTALEHFTRAELAQAVASANRKEFLEPLSRRFEIRAYRFARQSALLAVDERGPQFVAAEPGDTAATHLGDAIGRTLDDAAGRTVAGILVFSDGQNTGGRSPAEAAQAAARAAAPIFAVPTGSKARARDVVVTDAFTPGLVFAGDTARVSVTVASQGFDARPVKVELRAGSTLLDSKNLVLHDAEEQRIDLTFQAKEAGTKYLTVAVPPQPEEPEQLRANNTDLAFVRVSDEKLRVLLVDGLPRWDFRFLKNAMRRDHGLSGRTSRDEPAVLLESEIGRRPAAEQAAALPRSVRDLAEFHAVILGDVSSLLIDSTFAAALAEAVREHALGLVVASGPRFTPHALDEHLRELLPVRLQRSIGGLDAPVYKPFQLELSADGTVHEVMRLYDDPGRNGAAWGQMPPYYWCAAVERPAAGASVLAWNPSVVSRFGKLPVLAHHYAGRGRVFFVGTDSTWLWRRNVGDRFFYKFWGQAIRFVARRDQQGATKSWIEARPIRAQPGEKAEIELMAIGPAGQPHSEPTIPVQVELTGQAATTVSLAADPATKGRYTGKHTVKEPGEYRVSYQPGGGAPPVEAVIRVVAAGGELRNPNVNRPALEALAAATEGRLVELSDLPTIPPLLKGEAKLEEVHREASLWDNGLILILVMFVYSLDVALRRLAGLS